MGRRSNGFGTLVSKGSGKPWLAKWMYGGKVFTKSTGCVEKSRAYKELERLTRPFRERREIEVIENLELKLKHMKDGREKQALEVTQLWETFSKKIWDGSVSRGTESLYERYCGKLSSWLEEHGFKVASKVKREDAEKFLMELARGVGATTFNNMLAFYKRMWAELAGEWWLDKHAFEGFKKLKASKSSRRALQPEELWSMAEKAGADKDMMVLLALGMYTGLRLGDCACMEWKSIDFSRMLVRVVPMKTKRHMDGPLEIPMHPALAKALRDVWEDGAEKVSEVNFKRYRYRKLSAKVTELMRKCGISTVEEDEDGKKKLVAGFHSLRHTFISMAINSGMSPLLIQRIVGHSAVSMTAAYFHENAQVAAEGIAKLPDFLD